MQRRGSRLIEPTISKETNTETKDWKILLTHGRDNLRLQPELIGEAPSKVADTALAISGNVGDLADVIEHVPAGEEQDRNQAHGRPHVSVLYNGPNEGPGHCEECDDAEDDGCQYSDANIIDRASNGRSGTFG